jgi:hypothetical protein
LLRVRSSFCWRCCKASITTFFSTLCKWSSCLQRLWIIKSVARTRWRLAGWWVSLEWIIRTETQ